MCGYRINEAWSGKPRSCLFHVQQKPCLGRGDGNKGNLILENHKFYIFMSYTMVKYLEKSVRHGGSEYGTIENSRSR